MLLDPNDKKIEETRTNRWIAKTIEETIVIREGIKNRRGMRNAKRETRKAFKREKSKNKVLISFRGLEQLKSERDIRYKSRFDRSLSGVNNWINNKKPEEAGLGKGDEARQVEVR